MNLKRSRALQGLFATEAKFAVDCCPDANLSDYKQVIRLIGKASGIPRTDTEDLLQEIHEYQTNEDMVMEDPKPISALGGLGYLMDLFEVSVNLDQRGQRQAVFNMAQYIIDVADVESKLKDQ